MYSMYSLRKIIKSLFPFHRAFLGHPRSEKEASSDSKIIEANSNLKLDN